jgi:hypothetical protein
MFRSNTHKEIRDLRETLRHQLRDGFRTALDLATLGAYELTGPDAEAETLRPARQEHRGPVDRTPPKRVLLFAKVAPARCADAAAPADGVCRAHLAAGSGSNGMRRRQRRPSASAPEQPCATAAADSSVVHRS